MALPTNVSTGTVTGQFIVAAADGADTDYAQDTYPVQGTVTFTASVPYLPDPTATEPVTILPEPVVCVLDDAGYLCSPDPDNMKLPGRRGVQLIATDDPDLSVTGWTWKVTYAFLPRGKAALPQIPDHYILVPSNGTVDLASSVKVPASTGVGVDQVMVIRSEALQAAADADASATASAQSATAASGYASASAGSAAAASVSATAAGGSATASAGSATASGVSASAAAGSATSASGSAATSTAAATAASSSATSAAGSATAAASSATAAGSSATAASGSATAAATTATNLQADANNPASTWWTTFIAYLWTLFVGKGELVISVKDYGAVGNGVVDDRAAIQAAVDAINTKGGGTLFFPQGTYYTVSAVLPCSNLTITGDRATLTKGSASTSSVVFAGLSNGAQGYGSGPSNITMHGLAFRGKFGTSKRAVCAMALHHSENVLVHNCTFTQASGSGHRFDLQGCRNVTIRDNVFKGFDTSYDELYAEDIQVDFSARIGASYAESNLLSYDALPSRDITVENNMWLPLTVDGTTYPAGNPFGSHATMVGRYPENLTFRGNYIENPVNDTTSSTPGTLHFLAPKNLVIEDNVFVGNGNTCPAIKVYKAATGFTDQAAQQDNATTVAISPPQVFTTVRITGNTITGYTGGADCVRLDGAVDNHASNAIVENNIFTNNSPDNGATNSGPITVTIQYVDAVSYRGNKVKGSRRVCVISDCSSVIVAQNTGINIGANDINVNTSAQVTVTGNVLTNTKYYGIYINACTDVAVTGNSVEGRIYDASGPLIRVTTPVRAAVTGNVCKGLAGTSNKGIELSGTLASSLIANNIAIGFTLPITPSATTTGATVSGNVIT